MSELIYEESVFDDSSDLEESWAGENVTFDTSPASQSFVDSDSDSEPDEQKSSSGIGTSLMTATSYYYQLDSGKHIPINPSHCKDNFNCEDGNEPSNVVQEITYANLSNSTLRKTGSVMSNHCTRSNFKVNTTGHHPPKQLKKVLNYRGAG